mmetsp:Transcript_21534/g.63699  ORF Transcript_21534/g.63699 Transcript_21534/m.63699 type:complete len:203 (+) Transcript_21534:283-891(+)
MAVDCAQRAQRQAGKAAGGGAILLELRARHQREQRLARHSARRGRALWLQRQRARHPNRVTLQRRREALRQPRQRGADAGGGPQRGHQVALPKREGESALGSGVARGGRKLRADHRKRFSRPRPAELDAPVPRRCGGAVCGRRDRHKEARQRAKGILRPRRARVQAAPVRFPQGGVASARGVQSVPSAPAGGRQADQEAAGD